MSGRAAPDEACLMYRCAAAVDPESGQSDPAFAQPCLRPVGKLLDRKHRTVRSFGGVKFVIELESHCFKVSSEVLLSCSELSAGVGSVNAYLLYLSGSKSGSLVKFVVSCCVEINVSGVFGGCRYQTARLYVLEFGRKLYI